ncbi:hypothetical protein BDZ91DRAFT_799691 [Kalaharituber pfeilii]|nr:hypothetical protein BDZ91DRAFT_799691 [Kalaharituber pfeilii]
MPRKNRRKQGRPGRGKLVSSNPGGQAHNKPKEVQGDLFYREVLCQSVLDYSTFERVYEMLLLDVTSIYGLLTAESTRESFIMNFQEKAKLIIEFYRKLKPRFVKSAEQNTILAIALLEGIVLKLFVDQWKELFRYRETVDLIIVALQSYQLCGSPPGLAAQLFTKLPMFAELKLLERVAAHPVGGGLLGEFIRDPKYGKALFEHSDETMPTWIERLIQFSECGVDHNISSEAQEWKAIGHLVKTYSPEKATLSETEAQKGIQMDLSKVWQLSAHGKMSGKASGQAALKEESISIPPNVIKIFKDSTFRLHTPNNRDWERRSALTRRHLYGDFKVPLSKAVYGDNGRIVWHTYIAFDNALEKASQVILVWRIGNHKDVVQPEGIISRYQNTFSKRFIEACKIRLVDPITGAYLPQTFNCEPWRRRLPGGENDLRGEPGVDEEGDRLVETLRWAGAD